MRQIIFILVLSAILFPWALQQGLISDQNLIKSELTQSFHVVKAKASQCLEKAESWLGTDR